MMKNHDPSCSSIIAHKKIHAYIAATSGLGVIDGDRLARILLLDTTRVLEGSPRLVVIHRLVVIDGLVCILVNLVEVELVWVLLILKEVESQAVRLTSAESAALHSA